MRITEVPLKEKDGKVGVLVHNGYGGFWSYFDIRLAVDARIIDYWEKHKGDREFLDACRIHDSDQAKEVKTFLISLGYDPRKFDVYGFDDALKLEWIPKSSRFIIQEYDGYETIKIIDPDYGHTFE